MLTRSKTLICLFILTIGAIFLAPKAYAITETDISDNVTLAADYITNHYPDDNINLDNYFYVCGFNTRLNGFYICFIPSDIEYSASISYYGIETLPLQFSSSSSSYCYSLVYTPGTTPTENSYGRFNRSFTFTLGVNKTNDICYVYKSSEFNINNLNPETITLVDYDVNVFSPDFYNQSDVLLMQYNQSCGFNYSRVTAWFVNEQGRMTKIPISQTEPEGYTGLYCYPYEYSKFLTGFQVRLTTGENPLDYQLYWEQQLVVEFENVNYTTLSLYGLQSNKKFAPDVAFYKNPSDRLPLDNSETTQGYFTIDGKNYIGTNTIVTEENNVTGNFYLVGNWWTEDLGVSDLLFGMSFTQTDSNGNVTDGKGTTNYNNTVNNYIQQAQMGLNGVDNGASSFSADWSGQTLTNTAPYDNNFEFSDNTGKSLFTELFSMGNGFILEAVLGVLGIAIAAYVLFGKS